MIVPMDTLSDRQTRILKVLIDEYINTATPVGSIALEKKYNLGISPATIRNEMSELTNRDYLRQPHTSAGRVPTPKAMKFYINQLMEEKQMSLTEEVKAKENVWDSRHNIDNLMQSAVDSLSRRTHYLAIAATDDGTLWTHGHAYIFDDPNFLNFALCQSLFSIIDEEKRIFDLFFQQLTGTHPIEVLFGEELGWEHFEPIGIVAARFKIAGGEGAIGVVGPIGLPYHRIIPTVRYFGSLLEELASQRETV